MKSIPIFRIVLLLTVVILALTPFHQNNMIHALSILVVATAWAFAFHKVQEDSKKHEIVVERVEQLKTFSIQLQSLINKELVLVQDDVNRTRQIVSDSIDILQNSSADINGNMLSQRQCLEELLSALKERQSVTAENIKAISSEGVSTNNDDKEPISYFTSIESINESTKSSIDNMLIALQFEDVVGQISERVVQHIGDIRSTVEILSKLCESEFSSSFDEDIDRMQIEYTSIKDKLLKVSSKNLAAQKNMDEGEIELF